jgi:hypothetical protein
VRLHGRQAQVATPVAAGLSGNLLPPSLCRRAYFRSQVKDSESQSHYGSMR